jgi:ankyrin repeat protein
MTEAPKPAKQYDPWATHEVMMPIYEGDLKNVRKWLRKGADPDAITPYGEPGMQWALQHNHPELAETLLLFGANPNLVTKTGPILRDAVDKDWKNAIACTKVMMKAGADPNIQWKGKHCLEDLPPFMAETYTEMMKDLLEGGLDPNAHIFGPRPYLFFALWRGHEHVVKLLVEHGANVNLKTRLKGGSYYPWEMISPFRSARMLRMLELLIEHGMSPDAVRGKLGSLPHILVRRKNAAPVLKKLLAIGVDPESRWKDQSLVDAAAQLPQPARGEMMDVIDEALARKAKKAG